MKVLVVKPKAKEIEAMKELVRRASTPLGLARRVRVVLWTAEGIAGTEIAEHLDLTREAVSRIRGRFASGGVEGLFDQPKAGEKGHARLTARAVGQR